MNQAINKNWRRKMGFKSCLLIFNVPLLSLKSKGFKTKWNWNCICILNDCYLNTVYITSKNQNTSKRRCLSNKPVRKQ